MAREIERKFLVKNDDYKKQAQGTLYMQGYLNSAVERVVRVRTVNDKGFITIKGRTTGISRLEFEYEVPFKDVADMLEICEKPIIEKHRYKVDYKGYTWEIDEFHGANQDLTVAEIELPSEEAVFEKPSWVGREVSGDPRYFNSNLINHPYSEWDK
jgi:CYTH domain-containing protein